MKCLFTCHFAGKRRLELINHGEQDPKQKETALPPIRIPVDR